MYHWKRHLVWFFAFLLVVIFIYRHVLLVEEDTKILNNKNNYQFDNALKDWHNYTLIKLDSFRKESSNRANNFISSTSKDDYYKYGYHKSLSDALPLDRVISDIRDPLCKSKLYSRILPKTSIILPFHNEAPSVLLRSATSISRTAPSELIEEIIFVDDASSFTDLGDYFETSLKKIPKTRLIRSKQRLGLIQARTLGASIALGPVFTFLDSHIECGVNWLPPLLDRIAKNYRSVPQPMIDGIDKKSFEYAEQPGGIMRGSFSWSLLYKRLPITEKENKLRKDKAEPFFTPVQAGGLFSIHKDWFNELGGYDPFLKVWGGEQYEMSFKVWMCGGEMEEIPCSRIGHIYRGRMSFSVPGGYSVIRRNHERVANLWMDEYAQYYYKRIGGPPEISRLGDDLENRRSIRKKLNCKSFRWYMENVAYDQPQYYPPVEPPPYASGKCRSMFDTCLKIENGTPILAECSETRVKWMLTWHKDMRISFTNRCIDSMSHSVGQSVGLFECHGQGGNQLWRLHPTSFLLYNTAVNKCIVATADRKILLQICDESSPAQRWKFETVDFQNFNAELGPQVD